MGYIPSATTTTLLAKLTPIGRQLLVSTNSSLITKFSIGDSDRNYNVVVPLATGEVPTDGGNLGPNGAATNSITSNYRLKSFLLVNTSGLLQKSVELQSNNITSETQALGQTIVVGDSLTHNLIDRADFNTDSLVNLFYSFSLPITSAQYLTYSSTTFANGGFADTALSGIAQNNILVIGVPDTQYGEMLDGKAIKITLQTAISAYTIYSTFQNKGFPTKVEDVNYRETSTVTQNIGNNISFLFSDDIMKPNGGSDATLSWGTGFNSIKPFSQNRKSLYNLTTDSNLAQTADTCVGIAYLDKGFIVITDPTIVSNFSLTATTATTVTFDSISTSIAQNITCIAARGEFGTSTNPTFSRGDIASISEVGLYDDAGNLIAIAKTDRHLQKNVNQFLALGIKIIL